MKRPLLALAALCAPPVMALAPEAGDAPTAPFAFPHFHVAAAADAQAQAEAWRRWSEDLGHEMRSSMGTLFSGRIGTGKVVKGAPYSAEVITETNQPLADGNVIGKKTSGRVYRDGEGRTRQESDAQGRDATVFVSDPVAGRHIVMKPGAKRATVMPLARSTGAETGHSQVVKLDNSEVRVENGKVFLNGREVSDGNVVVKSKSGKEVRVEKGRITIDGKEIGQGDGSGSRVEVSREVVDGVPREEVRVRVVRIGDDSVPPLAPIPPMPPIPPALAPPSPLPPMPGVSTFRFESTAHLGKGVTTRLGSKEFDGVKAEGTSTMWTIPAGQIGNRNPIHVTKESWYSDDLQVTVYTRYNDPRTGESIYRLASIKRAEPAPDLFRIPEGYAVKGRDARGRAPEARPANPPG